MSVEFDRAYDLDPQVSLRPEPFGALAYHFGNRKLSFLRSADVVALVTSLSEHESVAAALSDLGIDSRRWPSFQRALNQLFASEMIHERVE